MRKAVLILFLLALLATGAFLFGRVVVAPGTTAVVVSGVSGLLEPPLQAGRFHFIWQRLLPGDSRIHVFPVGRHEHVREQAFLLPPGELPVLGEKEGFEIRLRLSLRLSLDDAAALRLASRGETNFNRVLERVFTVLETRTAHALASEADAALRADRAPAILPLAAAWTNELADAAREQLAPYLVRLETLRLEFLALPDPVHYLRLRDAVLAGTGRIPDRITQYQSERAKIELTGEASRARLAELEAIARLVTERPRLLDYLAIEKLSPALQLMVLPGSETGNVPSIYKALADAALARLPAVGSNSAPRQAPDRKK
jgi:hypothetical protein